MVNQHIGNHVVTFDLGLLLQDQMRAPKLKGAYYSVIAHPFFMAWDLLMWSNLALCLFFKVGNTCSALVHCLYSGTICIGSPKR